jgi:diguanylate cyclase (GGDEF)-like protein
MIAEQPEWARWLECTLLVALVAVLDHGTGVDLSLSIFYMGPVVLAAWFISRRAGILFAIMGVVIWGFLDYVDTTHQIAPLIMVWNTMAHFAFFWIALELVTSTKAAGEREAMLARTDSLTGVANGRNFADRAHLALSYLRRTGRPVTVAYIDLDHFKEINDALGHTEGDRLLHAVAQAVAGRLRATDLVARLGGDEFGVLLDDTDAAMAPKVLAVISAAIDEVIDGEWTVGCTIGAVTFATAPPSVDYMVRAADALMFRGKQEGRSRIIHEVWSGE